MQTLDDARRHCRSVGERIESAVANGEDLGAYFEGTQLLRFKVEKNGNVEKVVGGELGGDDSGIVVLESGVMKVWGDEIAGYAFDAETRAALVEFFDACFRC